MIYRNKAILAAFACATSLLIPAVSFATTVTQTRILDTLDVNEEYRKSFTAPLGPQDKVEIVEDSISINRLGASQSFNLFDTSLGTLTSVEVTRIYRDMNATLDRDHGCRTQEFPVRQSDCSVSTTRAGTVNMGVDFSNLRPNLPVINDAVDTISDFSEVFGYSFSGASQTTRTVKQNTTFQIVRTKLTDMNTLAAFMGTGTFSVRTSLFWFEDRTTTCTGNTFTVLGITGQRTIQNCGSGSEVSASFSADVQVVYTFEEPAPVVPLPAGLPLLLAGLGVLGLLKARRAA